MEHPPAVIAYLRRVDAEIVNFRRAIIKIYTGHYYKERAIIKISDDGDVTCDYKEFAPDKDEALAMKLALAKIDFPRTIRARAVDDELVSMTKGKLYEFIDRSTGEIIMVQERRILEDGTKKYLPWTFMSDGSWMQFEPEGGLPLWKPRRSRGEGSPIMVHEGAKSAEAAEKIARGSVPGHPWEKELEPYEHWGMIGGALVPHRTDWDELRRTGAREVVYVCDNDPPGNAALPKVSKALKGKLKGIRFGDRFPHSWDMADEFPEDMYKEGRFVGPTVDSLMLPATWATETVPPPSGKGRSTHIIRTDFAEEWLHCERPEVYVHRDFPTQIRTLAEFNNHVSPFSQAEDTGRLLKKEFGSKSAVLQYDPSEPSGVYVGAQEGIYINTYSPSKIKPEAGDIGPWNDFMEYLVPDADDRLELLRWCATLVARPATRMLYGVLMISETQGIGKGTLGERALTPLVGGLNVSTPSENEVVESQFNSWLAHKRLAVVHEIYAGQSSKAYNKLKSCITDRRVRVNRKHQQEYEIDNWIHIFACSNSTRAMKLSNDDRRWFVPRLTEEKRGVGYWEGLNDWFKNRGGLPAIAWWAERFVREEGAVQLGSAAPWSSLKKQIVEEGYSPGQVAVARLLEELANKIQEGSLPDDAFVIDLDLVAYIRDKLYEGRHNDRLERPATVRALAKACGWNIGEIRAQIKAWGPERLGGRIIARSGAIASTPPVLLGGENVAEAARRRPLELKAVVGV